MLILLKRDVERKHNCWWSLFLCECGKETLIRNANYFRKGRITKSCGCLKNKPKHNACKTRTYKSWEAMKNRCRNSNTPQWKDYGGRGITVCTEWQNSFETFYTDMGPRPPNTSIDRINNDLGYFKENCRWADRKTQVNNRRVSKKPASSDRQPEPVSVVLQSSE